MSHDRYFMDKIVDHLFVFGEGKITDFPGNYSDYRALKALELEAKYEESSQSSSEFNNSSKTKQTADPKNKLSFNEQKLYKKLEKEISNLEKKKEKLEAEFLKELSPEDIKEKTIALQTIQHELEDKTEQWFELSMKLEE